MWAWPPDCCSVPSFPEGFLTSQPWHPATPGWPLFHCPAVHHRKYTFSLSCHLVPDGLADASTEQGCVQEGSWASLPGLCWVAPSAVTAHLSVRGTVLAWPGSRGPLISPCSQSPSRPFQPALASAWAEGLPALFSLPRLALHLLHDLQNQFS